MQVAPQPRVCPSCQGRSYVIQRQAERAVASVCECARDCRQCHGRGHLYVEQEEIFSQRVGPKTYEVLAPCACQLLKKRVETFSKTGVPGVLAKASFENYRAFNEAQDRAKKMATAFAMGYGRGKVNKGFIVSGPVGTGKTHLLASALTHLVLETGVQAEYVEISLLYAQIRRGFQEGKSGGEIIGPLSEKEVVAIDELGKGRGSQFELETLDELIARRYNAGRTTLFATNYSLEPERGASSGGYSSTEDLKAQAKESQLLRERVGERIYSRLCEMCEFIELPKGTPDQRRTRQELEAKAATPARGRPPR